LAYRPRNTHIAILHWATASHIALLVQSLHREEPDESNDVSQDDEDEGSEDGRQAKHVKQDKATKKGSYLCITFSDVRLMLERQSRTTKGDYYQYFII
jgi:DNA helicase IV